MGEDFDDRYEGGGGPLATRANFGVDRSYYDRRGRSRGYRGRYDERRYNRPAPRGREDDRSFYDDDRYYDDRSRYSSNFDRFLQRSFRGGPLAFGRDRYDRRGYDRDDYYEDRYDRSRRFNDRDDDRYDWEDRNWVADSRNALFEAGITPPWFEALLGCFLYVLLNAAFKELLISVAPKTPTLDEAVGRLLAIAAFVVIQQASFIPTREWLRLDEWLPGYGRYYPRRPFFDNPLNGITFAFIFAVPLECIAAGSKAALKKGGALASGVGGMSGAMLLNLLAVPLSEELFFRAWLPTAFVAAGGSEFAGFIASTLLFGFYHVPFSAIATPAGSSALLAYWALGAYLSFLYQRSDGSLPLVIITHGFLRLIELGGGRALPFGYW